jgi:hypothetical protein
MNSAPVKILRNEKQALFLDLVLDNVADEVVPGKGGYQRGFTAFLQAGRAFGKTFTLLDLIAISAWMLPKALAGLGAKTFKQVLEIVLGQAEKVWSQYDLSEYDSKENPRGNYVLKFQSKFRNGVVSNIKNYCKCLICFLVSIQV